LEDSVQKVISGHAITRFQLDEEFWRSVNAGTNGEEYLVNGVPFSGNITLVNPTDEVVIKGGTVYTALGDVDLGDVDLQDYFDLWEEQKGQVGTFVEVQVPIERELEFFQLMAQAQLQGETSWVKLFRLKLLQSALLRSCRRSPATLLLLMIRVQYSDSICGSRTNM
jgi:hypothetical protein